MSPPVISVSAIRKTYGRTVAIDDISFEVKQGEIFGLIGPNGAGKTTTMECVEGVRVPDSGRISVLGLDPVRQVYALQASTGKPLWRFRAGGLARSNPMSYTSDGKQYVAVAMGNALYVFGLE